MDGAEKGGYKRFLVKGGSPGRSECPDPRSCLQPLRGCVTLVALDATALFGLKIF